MPSDCRESSQVITTSDIYIMHYLGPFHTSKGACFKSTLLSASKRRFHAWIPAIVDVPHMGACVGLLGRGDQPL